MIELEQVCKSFNGLHAVDDISFTAGQGRTKKRVPADVRQGPLKFPEYP